MLSRIEEGTKIAGIQVERHKHRYGNMCSRNAETIRCPHLFLQSAKVNFRVRLQSPTTVERGSLEKYSTNFWLKRE